MTPSLSRALPMAIVIQELKAQFSATHGIGSIWGRGTWFHSPKIANGVHMDTIHPHP